MGGGAMRVTVKREGDWFGNALFKWNFAGVKDVVKDRTGPRVEDALKAACPRKPGWDHPERGAPGEMAESIDHTLVDESEKQFRIEWSAHVPWAAYVVRGTSPHRIVPHGPYPLRWTDADGLHQALAVNHPGARPNAFPDRVLEEQKESMVEDFSEAVAEAFRGEV